MIRTSILVLAAVALLTAEPAPGRGDDDAFPPDVQQLLSKQRRRRAAREQAALQELAKARPVVYADPTSLVMLGDGLEGRTYTLHARGHLWANSFLLAGGTLYYEDTRDFHFRAVRLHLDPQRDAARVAAHRLEDAREWQAVLKKLPPAAAKRFGGEDTEENRKRADEYTRRLTQLRTPVDLALIDSLSYYESVLKGPLALTPQQIGRVKESLARRQETLEKLGRLAAALTKDQPGDETTRREVFAVLDQLKLQPGLTPEQRELFTPEQRRAMGLEPDPDAKPRPMRGVSVGASSGGEDGSTDRWEAEYRKQRAREEREERVNRRSARVRCELQGKGASAGKWSVRTPAGLLWMYVDVRQGADDRADFLFHLDAERTWAVEKAEQLRQLQATEDELRSDPEFQKYLREHPEEAKEFAGRKARLEQAPNYYVAQWSYPVDRLRAKTGAVPADVQARFDRMVQEMSDAGAAALTAYREAVARPGEARPQRKLFEAVRHAVRVEGRNRTLMMRDHYDEDGRADELPWLLTMDQVDLINQGQLTTGSSASTGGTGSVSITARPAGKKQYVSVTAQGMSLGELAEEVQRVARRYYHNHRLELVVDPQASESAVRGVVEGKSAEELFKSLAIRSGVMLEKDDKAAHRYRLKP